MEHLCPSREKRVAMTGLQRHLHLTRAEHAAGLAFGFQEPDQAGLASRLHLIWAGGLMSAACLVAAATLYTGF